MLGCVASKYWDNFAQSRSAFFVGDLNQELRDTVCLPTVYFLKQRSGLDPGFRFRYYSIIYHDQTLWSGTRVDFIQSATREGKKKGDRRERTGGERGNAISQKASKWANQTRQN